MGFVYQLKQESRYRPVFAELPGLLHGNLARETDFPPPLGAGSLDSRAREFPRDNENAAVFSPLSVFLSFFPRAWNICRSTRETRSDATLI